MCPLKVLQIFPEQTWLLSIYLFQVLNHPPAHRSNEVSEVEPSKSIEVILSISVLHRLLQTRSLGLFSDPGHLQRDPRDLTGSAPNQPGPQSHLLLSRAVQPFLVFKAKLLVAVEASLVPLNGFSEMSGFCGAAAYKQRGTEQNQCTP